jgi:hypothetical protein
MHDVLVHIASSAAAGFIGRLLFHPIDTIKANMQSTSSKLATTLKNESLSTSVRALYRGFGVTVIAGTPATITYLNTYEAAKGFLEKHTIPRHSEFSVYLCSGLCAEAVACVIFVPLDVIKERMQVQGAISLARNSAVSKVAKKEYYGSTLDAIQKISKQEGIYGFYKGYGASIISFGPFSAIYFAIYEGMKKEMVSYEGLGSAKELKFQDNLVCSSVAGAVSAWTTNPLDLAKLRLQLRRANKNSISNEALDSTFGQIRHIYKTEGIRVFFKGAGTRVLFHAPNTAVVVSKFNDLSLSLACISTFIQCLNNSDKNTANTIRLFLFPSHTPCALRWQHMKNSKDIWPKNYHL